MKRVLVPVDGSLVANRAVLFAIEQAGRADGLEINLLNVQQGVERWYKHGLLSDEVRKEIRRHGEAEAAEARTLLDKSKVQYEFEVVFGHPAEVIVRTAREKHCDAIVMGTRGLGGVENLMLGSTAYKVVQLTEMPVTFVK